jgi:hypothetical protein
MGVVSGIDEQPGGFDVVCRIVGEVRAQDKQLRPGTPGVLARNQESNPLDADAPARIVRVERPRCAQRIVIMANGDASVYVYATKVTSSGNRQ